MEAPGLSPANKTRPQRALAPAYFLPKKWAAEAAPSLLATPYSLLTTSVIILVMVLAFAISVPISISPIPSRRTTHLFRLARRNIASVPTFFLSLVPAWMTVLISSYPVAVMAPVAVSVPIGIAPIHRRGCARLRSVRRNSRLSSENDWSRLGVLLLRLQIEPPGRLLRYRFLAEYLWALRLSHRSAAHQCHRNCHSQPELFSHKVPLLKQAHLLRCKTGSELPSYLSRWKSALLLSPTP